MVRRRVKAIKSDVMWFHQPGPRFLSLLAGERQIDRKTDKALALKVPSNLTKPKL